MAVQIHNSSNFTGEPTSFYAECILFLLFTFYFLIFFLFSRSPVWIETVEDMGRSHKGKSNKTNWEFNRCGCLYFEWFLFEQ